jgi:hypothetical protein
VPYGFSQTDWDEAKNQARDLMIARARVRGMISYSELTEKITAISLMPNSTALSAMLGEISTEEDGAGRGMLSVIVVHKVGDMEPGKGFYELAKHLGKPTEDRMTFWIAELHRVHAQWG